MSTQQGKQCDGTSVFICLASKLEQYLVHYKADPDASYKPWSDSIDERLMTLAKQLDVIGIASEVAVCHHTCLKTTVQFVVHRCENLIVSLLDLQTESTNLFFHKGVFVTPALAATLLRFGLREAQQNKTLSPHDPKTCIICTQEVDQK